MSSPLVSGINNAVMIADRIRRTRLAEQEYQNDIEQQKRIQARQEAQDKLDQIATLMKLNDLGARLASPMDRAEAEIGQVPTGDPDNPIGPSDLKGRMIDVGDKTWILPSQAEREAEASRQADLAFERKLRESTALAQAGSIPLPPDLASEIGIPVGTPIPASQYGSLVSSVGTRQRTESEQATREQQALESELEFNARALPDNQEDWTAWREGLSPGLRKRIPPNYTKGAADWVERMAVPIKERESIDRWTQQFNETKRHNQAMENKPAGGASYSTTEEDLDDTARAIMEGQAVPVLTSYSFRDRTALAGRLRRMGYNQARAETDWKATQKHLATLNGAQQERLRQAVTFTHDSLDVIEGLYDEWKKTPYYLNQRTLNKASLAAAKQAGGESGAVAQALEAQINDLISELATVYKGGNSSTDESLKLAAENLKANWDEKAFTKALNLIRTNLQIRKNSILTSAPAGVSAGSPYVPPEQAPEQQEVIRWEIGPDGQPRQVAGN